MRAFEDGPALVPGTICRAGTALILDGRAGVGVRREATLAFLSAGDLAIQWTQSVGAVSLAGVRGSTAVLCARTAVLGFDVVRRREAWRIECDGALSIGRYVLVRSLKASGTWSVLDWETGKLGETFRPGGVPETIVGGICVSSSPVQIGADGSLHSDGMITAVQVSTGRELWQRPVVRELGVLSAIGFYEGTFASQVLGVTVDQDLVAALDLSDGRLLWRAAVRVPYVGLLVSNGQIPVLSHGNDACSRFVVIDERTGDLLADREKWTGMIHEKPGSMLRDDIVAFPSESGHIAVFSTVTGECLAIEQTKRSLWTSTVVDDRLVVASSTGEVLAYRLEDGEAPAPGPKKTMLRKRGAR